MGQGKRRQKNNGEADKYVLVVVLVILNLLAPIVLEHYPPVDAKNKQLVVQRK